MVNNRGKRRYQCQECKHYQFVHWIELNRAKRLACTHCGSVRLEPSAVARDEAADHRLYVKNFDKAQGDVTRPRR